MALRYSSSSSSCLAVAVACRRLRVSSGATACHKFDNRQHAHEQPIVLSYVSLGTAPSVSYEGHEGRDMFHQEDTLTLWGCMTFSYHWHMVMPGMCLRIHPIPREQGVICVIREAQGDRIFMGYCRAVDHANAL